VSCKRERKGIKERGRGEAHATTNEGLWLMARAGRPMRRPGVAPTEVGEGGEKMGGMKVDMVWRLMWRR